MEKVLADPVTANGFRLDILGPDADGAGYVLARVVVLESGEPRVQSVPESWLTRRAATVARRMARLDPELVTPSVLLRP